jgi:hypothetical protein
MEALRALPHGHCTSTCPSPVMTLELVEAPHVQERFSCHLLEPIPRQSPQPWMPPQVPALQLPAAAAGVAVNATAATGVSARVVVAARAAIRFLMIMA